MRDNSIFSIQTDARPTVSSVSFATTVDFSTPFRNTNLILEDPAAADGTTTTTGALQHQEHPEDNRQSEIPTNNPVQFISRNHDWYYQHAPLLTFFTAFVLAWIYTMIPSNNYFVFFLIKEQLWNMLSTACFTELFAVTIPDVNDEIYILAYLIGFLTCPLFAIASKDTGYDNSTVVALVTTVTFLASVILFGYNVLMFPKSSDQLRRQKIFEQFTDGGKRPMALSDEPQLSSTSSQSPTLFRSMLEATRFSRASRASILASPLAIFGFGSTALQIRLLPETTIDSSAPAVPEDPSVVSRQQEESHEEEILDNIKVETSATFSDEPRDPLFPLWVSQVFHRQYFFFFPKFWRWYQWERVSKLPHNVDRRFLWVVISLLVYLFTQDYLFLVLFTNKFRQSGRSLETGIKLFIVYILVTTTFRIVIKFLGMQLDKYRNKTVSMYFIGEVMGLLYYYTFYRVLFESIHSIGEFALFQFVHLAAEWILYPIRSSQLYYNVTEHCMETLIKPYWPCFGGNSFSYRHWQEFIALDFGIRCSVFVSTGYGIILLLLTIQFVPWVGESNGLKQDIVNFRYTTLFLFVAIVLELINAFAIMKYYFEPRKLDSLRMTRHCYSLRHFAFLSMLIAANLFINPVYTFTTVPTA